MLADIQIQMIPAAVAQLLLQILRYFKSTVLIFFVIFCTTNKGHAPLIAVGEHVHVDRFLIPAVTRPCLRQGRAHDDAEIWGKGAECIDRWCIHRTIFRG